MSTSLKVWLQRISLVCGAAVASSIALAAVAAGADGASPTPSVGVELQEVVVTATRRQEVISKIPESVAALSASAMDEQGVKSISDVARLVPGVNLAPTGQTAGDLGGWGTTIAIRGITSVVGSATTGIYIDDTPVQVRHVGNAVTNPYPQVFDLDRIEVLRGPQGTLFGAGAEGGAVRFITPQPSFTEFGGYSRAELADTQGGGLSYEAGVAVGGPIVQDQLGFRVSAWYRRDGGYIDSVDPTTGATFKRNANFVDNDAIRGAFAWKLTDQLVVTLSAFNQTQVFNGSPNYSLSLSDPSNGDLRSANYLQPKQTDRFTLPMINVKYQGTGFDVISTTSYLDRAVDRTVDYTVFIGEILASNPYAYGPGQSSVAYINDRQYAFTQEVRIQSNTQGRVEWLAGAFYQQSHQLFYQTNIDPYLNSVFGFPLIPNNGSLLFADQVQSTDKQLAGFGQLDYELVKGLKVIAGVRVEQVKFNSQTAAEGPIAGPQVLGTVSTQSETPVLPKFGVSYQINDANMVYATASKGFRIGGVNGPSDANCASALATLGLTENPDAYQSDTVWSYEVGSKSRLLGDALQIYASIYDIEWKNIQHLVSLQSCGGGFITNLGSARSKGADIEINARPVKNLTLQASVAYTNARLSETVFAGTNGAGAATIYGYSGDPLGVTPWSIAASGEYDLPNANGHIRYGRIDFQHVAGTNAPDQAVFGADPEVNGTDSYNSLSARIGMRFSGVDLSIFGNNLLNESPVFNRFRYTTAPADQFFYQTTVRPRTFGITAIYHF